LLEGLIETLEHVLGVPVKLARVVHPEIASLLNREGAMSERTYVTYINTLGAIEQAMTFQELPRFSLKLDSSIRNPFVRVAHKAKEVYQEYF